MSKLVDDIALTLKISKAQGNPMVMHEFKRYEEVVNRVQVLHETDRFCKCGTCTEAIEAAYRLYDQLRQNHCSYWVEQIATALQFIGQAEDAARLGVTYEELRTPSVEDTTKITPERRNEIEVLGELSGKAANALHLGAMAVFGNSKSKAADAVAKVEAKVYEEDKDDRWQ